MTTAISVTPDAGFGILDPQSEIAEIIAENVGDSVIREQDLVHVKMPAGGSTTWTWERQGNTETADDITGILVACGYRGHLWPTEEMSGQRPLITCHDGRHGYKVGDDFGDINPATLEKYLLEDGTYDWRAMANGPDYGYGTSGRGKRARETAILAILQPNQMWPLMVHVSGGSLGKWESFRKMLSVRLHQVVITLALEKVKNLANKTFARVVFKHAGTLTAEQGALVKATYTENLNEMLRRTPGASAPSSDDAAGERVPF